MTPKKQNELPQLFQSRLDQMLNMKHPLCILAQQIKWEYFEKEFGALYSENQGSPGRPIRLLVGLHYLKHAFNESDEGVVERFIENPYWQYFCGFEYFQHQFPIDPSTLTRWRQRVGSIGVEKMLAGLLETAKRAGLLKHSDLNQVNVDTTVQEKAIAFPTDARLYYKMREALVRQARSRGVELRQSYTRLAKRALIKQGKYSHARQMKRARKSTRQLKTYFGRVYRDILRKVETPDKELAALLARAEKLLAQKKNDKNKIYSIHAPEVECISKGKVHKKYEFGCKTSMVSSSRGNWILGVQAVHGNPYDGHTLASALEQVERTTGWKPRKAYVDLGYRGHGYEGDTEIHLVNNRTMKRMTRSVKRWMKRRSAIEPIIGHTKSENRLNRNYLKGEEGDRINAILAGCGFNMRKLLRAFFLPLLIRALMERFRMFLSNYKYKAALI